MSNILRQQEISKREIKIKPIKLLKKEFQTEDALKEDTRSTATKLEQARMELVQVQQETNRIQEETQESIQLERENWTEEKQQWIEQAKAEGFQVGFEQGKTESITVYQDSLKQANHIVDLVKTDYQKTLEKTEDVIVQLAIHTAEKILEEKLQEQPKLFMHIVKSALKEIKNQSVISIYLHPVNYEIVLEQKAELKRILENDTKLSIYINEELAENACIIEHPFGQIDATVDTQLEQIRSALNELVMETKQ